jgi:glycosyltransferase involved in cell wall biosynthesis
VTVPVAVSVLPTDLAVSRGGGERCAHQIHANLRALLPSWDLIALGASSDPERAPVPDGWRNVVRRGSGEAHAQDALSIPRLLAAVPWRAELVIAHQWRTMAMAALRVRPRRGFMIAIDHGGGNLAGSRLARLPLPRVDLASIQSVFEARMTPMQGRRVCNMRGGIVAELFAPPGTEQRSIDFLMVGRWVPHKGQREFLQALPAGARAMLVGQSGTYDPAYRDEVLKLAAERQVEVQLDLSDDELVRAYQRTRYVVQVPIAPPGTAPELLGLSLLEGMACGAVPICPRHGASAEFARHDDTGLQYEDNSVDDLRRSLTRAHADEDGRIRMAAAAVNESRIWTWRAAAETLLREAGIPYASN